MTIVDTTPVRTGDVVRSGQRIHWEEFDEGERTAGLSCPALVIHGDGDAIAPVARGRELARLSNADLWVIEGCGHEPHCRFPRDVNATIASFLATAKSV